MCIARNFCDDERPQLVVFIAIKSCYLKYFLTGGLFVHINGISLEMFLDWRFGFLDNSIILTSFPTVSSYISARVLNRILSLS